MESRIETVLEDWRFRACDPGYAGLNELADAGFSGVVTTDGTRGFMVNGRLIGIDRGTIEAFWSSELEARESENPALPLLCAMWLAPQAVEAEYYTGETSIAEVDQTLSRGNFTGFLELTENVFSGDYYVVYYGGTSFSVAFIGTEERLLTGDPAFERADDEVGIYTVNSVEIDVIEIPDPEVDESITADARGPGSGDPSIAGQPTDPPEAEQVEVDDAAPSTEADAEGEAENDVDDEPAESVSERNLDPEAGSVDDAVESSREENLATLAAAAKGASFDDETPPMGADDAAIHRESGELHVIPSLDPERTTLPATDEKPEPALGADPDDSIASDPIIPKSDAREPPATPSEEDRSDLESALAEARKTNEELEAEIEERAERIAELEAELEELKLELDVAGDPSSAATARLESPIENTNLFVRYRSKADFTLNDAIDGGADPDDVRRNLKLEWHTDFDTDEVTIDGQSFDAFLEESPEYRFAFWLVAEFLFELRDTGGDKGLLELYETIPEIDRIEFRGGIPVQTREDGDRGTAVHKFDVVCRNSMGDPLLVADLNADRDPVGGEAVSRLITSAHEVANARSTLTGAIFVTTSYYEPDALEAVTTSTEGGFLRGGSKESYVRVSRKRGFHLCLIESRDASFHLAVPEL